MASETAIILENAFWETSESTPLKIPGYLKASLGSAAWIVQSRGPPDDEFRSVLRQVRARIICYIPNNAYLVRASRDVTQDLQKHQKVARILAFEPFFKLKGSLLALAVEGTWLPPDAVLRVLVFEDCQKETSAMLTAMGCRILAREVSPFGVVVDLQAPPDSIAPIACLDGVQELELKNGRLPANDVSRVTMGAASSPTVSSNYLNLTGTNILLAVIDTGVDTNHPDLKDRLLIDPDYPRTGADDNGHGTHVAGIIAGTGLMSDTVTNAHGSTMPGVQAQFRGKSPGARLLISDVSAADSYSQERAAANKCLVSNNSWTYSANDYDLAAASFDAAARDALPTIPGAQALLFVFPAGNAGALNNYFGGVNDSGIGGVPDNILSPGTAKNVITVGALEQPRNVDSEVTKCDSEGCTTNQPWMKLTDSGDQIASFSSRGNVGIGIEGPAGRFKPDVVAPGSFIFSTVSSNWNKAAYYNPTSYLNRVYSDLSLRAHELRKDAVFVPANAVRLAIQLLPNRKSPDPLPALPIYINRSGPATPNPGGFEFVKTNAVVLMPPDGGPDLTPRDKVYYYSITNQSEQTVYFDVVTRMALTNEHGNYLNVLADINTSVGPYYRYESGTSLAAAQVTGLLGLMQEFYEQRVRRTNSPALMKALMINAGRSVNPLYDLSVRAAINYQGWGVPDLMRSAPEALLYADERGSPVLLCDQNPTNALATGQTHTFDIALSPDAQEDPLRITLVWTDPPANPLASIKLVNDLDLVVTNLDSGDLYWGNDILPGNDFNTPWDTNSPPNLDAVNNVENVYIPSTFFSSLGTRYAVTVVGKRVNVNAVSAHTNQFVQDYALVISSGNGGITNALRIIAPVSTAAWRPEITAITNMFPPGGKDLGGYITDRHIGASTPLLGTRKISLASGAGQITLGLTNQWNFYTFTNETSYTNAAFLTFLPPNLAVPRMAATNRVFDTENAARQEADVDLYVSLDPGLTNLDSAAISEAYKSLGRGGTETIVLSNATPGVYYIGVKSEDAQGAIYSIMAVVSELPFSQRDANGNLLLRGFPVPADIPDGTAKRPSGVSLFSLAIEPISLRRVIVTNILTHQLMGDLVGILAHGSSSVVLNNHSTNLDVANRRFIYDDTDEYDVRLSHHTDGPGTLVDFASSEGAGQWRLTEIDNAPGHVGIDQGFGVFLERQQDLNSGITATILPGACRKDYIYVPPEATNLTVTVGVVSGTGPLSVHICRQDGDGSECVSGTITNSAGISLEVAKTDNPPLNPGVYSVRICNQGTIPVVVNILATLRLDLNAVVQRVFTSTGAVVLRDESVNYSSLLVTNEQKIASVDVGLRVDHPRVSDLAFTLISPAGSRVLLCENRGGLSTNGLGTNILITNIVHTTSTAGRLASTNEFDAHTNSGVLTISYDFQAAPNEMHVYYDSRLMFDSGRVAGSGSWAVPFGPGVSTKIKIIMDEGSTPTQDFWAYTATWVRPDFTYLTLTENTNLAVLPIKFARFPLTSGTSSSSVPLAGFEADTPGTYAVSAVLEGWQVSRNPVSIQNDPSRAHTGTQFLALRSGGIRRSLQTIAGRTYNLRLAYRKAPLFEGPVSWWPAEGDARDIADGNHGTSSATVFRPGLVGQAFEFNGANGRIMVPDALNLRFSTAMTVEMWVYTRSWGGRPREMLSKWEGTGDQRSYTFSISASPGTLGKGYFLVSSDGGFVNNTVVYSRSVIPLDQWAHLAGVYDGSSLHFYVNGVRENSVPWMQGLYRSSTAPLIIGSTLYSGSYYDGWIDEPALFNRALSASEIKAIYEAGPEGKCGLSYPPAACPVSGAEVIVDGLSRVRLSGTDQWLTNTVAFLAARNGTDLEIAAVDGPSGLLLDSITLQEVGPAGNCYFPEDSLTKLTGEKANGDWQLEVWDNRIGAVVPAPKLVSWQLRFILCDSAPLARLLAHATQESVTIRPHEWAEFSVDAPEWARAATNSLLASAPVDLVFNQSRPPRQLQGNAPLVQDSVDSSTATLFLDGVPALLPGQRYYIGVYNPWSTNITVAVQVSFDVRSLVAGETQSHQITSSDIPAVFSYEVSSNASAVSFHLEKLSGDAALFVRKGLLPSTFGDVQAVSYNPNNHSEEVLLFRHGTDLPLLSPGTWYVEVMALGVSPAEFAVSVSEYANDWPAITQLVNGVPVTGCAAPSVPNFYHFKVSTNAARVQFELGSAQTPVTLFARRGLPLPDSSNYDFGSTNQSRYQQLIVILNSSRPVALTSGDWFLAALNPSSEPTEYTIEASEFSWPATNVRIVHAALDGDDFWVYWPSLPGIHYYLEGCESLNGPWETASSQVTASDYVSSCSIPLSSKLRFFRVCEGLVPSINEAQ